jgi:hypothetical protein
MGRNGYASQIGTDSSKNRMDTGFPPKSVIFLFLPKVPKLLGKKQSQISSHPSPPLGGKEESGGGNKKRFFPALGRNV